jgi:two-component system OmpR family sensor kinase
MLKKTLGMSEPDTPATGANKQQPEPPPSNGKPERPSETTGPFQHSPSRDDALPLSGSLYYSDRVSQPLFVPLHEPESRKAPSWLRPFFSLRIQLTLVYGLILILVMSCSSIVLYHRGSVWPFVLFVATGVTIGTALAYLFTSLLLRPLWQVTDAAQAIASGDLEQRERLPIRLPPQDEIDRLAGSLNEMVTRVEHAQEMQRASEERFRRFVSDASHQLRTPLTSIRGFTELLLRGLKDDAEMVPRILKRMKGETERMTNLIADLLTIARLDDAHPLRLKYCDLVELAVTSVEQTRSRANDERKISLIVAVNERLGFQGDRERMKQLLFILLDNALKYGRPAPDGTITVKLDKRSGQVEIMVIDNGEGIAREDVEHIFDAFYRGRHRSTPAITVGSGLGLTIASAITRAHNGVITVYSEPGKGTEFKVTLPSAN